MRDLAQNFENAIKYNLFLPVKSLAAAVGLCDFGHVEKFYGTVKNLFRNIISEHEKEFDNAAIPKVSLVCLSLS